MNVTMEKKNMTRGCTERTPSQADEQRQGERASESGCLCASFWVFTERTRNLVCISNIMSKVVCRLKKQKTKKQPEKTKTYGPSAGKATVHLPVLLWGCVPA